jgi:hypothetical protein
MHPTGIVHLAAPFAFCEFMTQIGEPNIGAKFLNQILLSILAIATAARA